MYILPPNKGVETEANKRGGSEVLPSWNMKNHEIIKVVGKDDHTDACFIASDQGKVVCKKTINRSRL